MSYYQFPKADCSTGQIDRMYAAGARVGIKIAAEGENADGARRGQGRIIGEHFEREWAACWLKR